MIEIENLTKYFGDNRALNNLSFKVATGEIIGLVGKNGAGKSTALKILSAQMLPSAGSVWVDGVSVTDQPQAVRARLGYLPESAPLYGEMTVAAYLTFAGRLRQIPKERVADRLAAVVEETGLTHVLGERLSGLSRGYQQRVGIAQAMIHRPPVVLLDEPMGGLDPLQIVQIRDLIQGLRGQHTVLFSSHILSEITNICDRVVLIDKGAVRAEGSETSLRRDLSPWRLMSLLVRGAASKVKSTLAAVDGVSVQSVGEAHQGVVQVKLALDEDQREAVAKACATGGLGLLEMKSEADGLEDLFLQLVGKGENAA